MQRKQLGYILIGGGLTLAVFVGVMVYSQVSEAEKVKASLPTARVVIATGDIPARSEIAASMINVRTVPDELVQAGAATKVEDVVGKFSPDAITKGSVINTQKIGPVAVKNAPSFRIEKGKYQLEEFAGELRQMPVARKKLLEPFVAHQPQGHLQAEEQAQRGCPRRPTLFGRVPGSASGARSCPSSISTGSKPGVPPKKMGGPRGPRR